MSRIGIAVAAGGHLMQTSGYGWQTWNAVRWRERRKGGWNVIRRAMLAANAPIDG
jgi:hypothetical protein